MKKKKEICIALFAYNRPSHLKRVIISLEDYKIKNDIHLFLDGPKNKSDIVIHKDIIFMIKTNKRLKIRLYYSKKNKGAAKSISNGLDLVSKIYKNIIVLEDDVIPRKEFFPYLNGIIKHNILNNYAAACGYQLPQLHDEKSRIINIISLQNFIPWGWLVNSNYWQRFRKNLSKINKSNNKYSSLLNQISKKVGKKNKNIWSLNFMIFNYLNKLEYIFPSKSLIKNIGFDGSGINSKASSAPQN